MMMIKMLLSTSHAARSTLKSLTLARLNPSEPWLSSNESWEELPLFSPCELGHVNDKDFVWLRKVPIMLNWDNGHFSALKCNKTYLILPLPSPLSQRKNLSIAIMHFHTPSCIVGEHGYILRAYFLTTFTYNIYFNSIQCPLPLGPSTVTIYKFLRFKNNP